MKGREIILEERADGTTAAALRVDGRLEDLLADPPPGDVALRPEAIYVARAGRALKSAGGMILDLGEDRTGFLRGGALPAHGSLVLVQVAGWTEPPKAARVTTRVRLRGRGAVLTPGAAGIGISRSIAEKDLRERLAACAAEAMSGAEPDCGLILRSVAGEIPIDELSSEIARLRQDWHRIDSAASKPGLAHPGPDSRAVALREWDLPGTAVTSEPGAFDSTGILDDLALATPKRVPLETGAMTIEATAALVAVDVDTDGATSPAAGLRANRAAMTELPRQLRLRGLGGQIVIDMAPTPKEQRAQVERALSAALRGDPVPTDIAGWTNLGHLELSRRNDRRPISL